LQYTAIDKDLTSKNSTSLLRKPGAKEDFVRGRTGQFPFSPGGLEGVSETEERSRYRINEKTQLGPLPSIPPGFTRGLGIKPTDEDMDLETTDVEDQDESDVVVKSIHVNPTAPQKQATARTGFEEIDDLLPEEVHSTSQ